MTQPFPKKETRQALVDALPANDQAFSSPSEVAYTYVPPSHARALDPENTIVEGIRGAGKSFWWAALGRGGIEDERPEDYVVSGLVDFDDISYDDHADLLYDLAAQTVQLYGIQSLPLPGRKVPLGSRT